MELAEEKGIRGTDMIHVISARGTYTAKAFVTRRLKPMMIDGKKVLPDWIADSSGLTAESPRMREETRGRRRIC